MPWRPSTSHSRTLRPCVASDIASAAATVVLPVPPLPVTMCSRVLGVTSSSLVLAPDGGEYRGPGRGQRVDQREVVGSGELAEPDAVQGAPVLDRDPVVAVAVQHDEVGACAVRGEPRRHIRGRVPFWVLLRTATEQV